MIDKSSPPSIEDDFFAYLKKFTKQKSVQLLQSNSTIPNRFIRLAGLDLSVANGEAGSLNFKKFNFPITGLHVERIYSTASPTVNKTGFLKFAPDNRNIGNMLNYKILQVNDAFSQDTEIADFYLGWDAQADTSADVVCYIDVDYRPGSTYTQILGSVSVVNSTATALRNQPIAPTAINRIAQAVAGTVSFTVPAGSFAIVTITGTNSTGSMNASIGGTVVFILNAASENIAQTFKALAGEVISLTVASAGNLYAEIEQYPV